MLQSVKRLRKWTAVMLICALFLTGCSSGTEGGQQSSPGQENGEADGAVTDADGTGSVEGGEKSMGRYLEKEVEVPEDVRTMGSYPVAYLQKMENGELALLEQVAGLYRSGDNGESWNHEEMPWLSELAVHAYIADIALAQNGAAAVIYDGHEDEQDEAEEADYVPEYLYVDADGNKKDIVFEEPDNFLNGFWFDQESRLYTSDMNKVVYEVNPEDGAMKRLFDVKGLVDSMCFTKNYIIAFTSLEVAVYDRNEEMLSDGSAVFQDFIMENEGNAIGSSEAGHAVMAVEGEQDDVIYFACSGGLYRYVIGGTAMEQIIDGNLSSLGDPSMVLCGLAALPDNEFMVLYNDVRLYRYTYEPDVPTVPEEQIGVYSLRENYSMRQAVSLFQKGHPDVYIRYEIGLSDEGGETAEDAIKNLNTKIMSGSGPDILVLDGLPIDSYKEKGIFADVSSVLDGMGEEDKVFANIVEACREDGKIYAFPMRIQIPIIVGKTEDIHQVKDLGTLADTLEEMRKENSEGGLLGFQIEEQLLYTLGQTSAAAWIKEDGSLDKEALTEFLTDAARIYRADTAGYEEAEIERMREQLHGYSAGFSGEGRYYATASTGVLDIAMGGQKMAAGKMYRMDFDFNVIATLAEQENLDYALWQGQVPGGFIPDCLAGVYSGSAEKELALEFYRFLFSRKVQDNDLSGGFPVNEASFDSFAESPRSGQGYSDGGYLAISAEDGDDVFSLDVQWADAGHFNRLKEMIKSVTAISTGNASIEEIVYETGVKALDGSMTVEDAVKEIEKKAALYLAE